MLESPTFPAAATASSSRMALSARFPLSPAPRHLRGHAQLIRNGGPGGVFGGDPSSPGLVLHASRPLVGPDHGISPPARLPGT